jgi:uncharacterized protein (TIGR03437 family)
VNRRKFLSTASFAPAVWRLTSSYPHIDTAPRRVPDLVRAALVTPNLGFPSVIPIFSGVFVPSTAPSKLMQTESWTDFTTEAQRLSATMQVSCLTAIQNMGRTWYYAAFRPGSANYFFFQTGDLNVFQATFIDHQSAYTLVDLNITWQNGGLIYSGCWVASSAPDAQSLVLGIEGFTALTNKAAAMSSGASPMQMVRVKSYPVLAAPQFAALFRSGTGGVVVHDMPVAAFASEVSTLSSDTLADISYNIVDGHLTGCWQTQIAGAKFFVNQEWDVVTQMAENSNAMLLTMAVYPDAPSFDDYFAANLAPYVMGYGYAVAKDGQIIGSGGGYARSPHESSPASEPFTADTRLTLASVSKAITGVALEKLALEKGISLDTPVLSLLGPHAPNQPSAAAITLRDLARMQSGLYHETQNDEGPADLPQGDPDIWTEIANYLAMPPAGPPGVGYYYDNTNYSILQGVIEQQSGMDYTSYVTQNVIIPAGMDPQIVNADPMSQNTPPTLIYSGPNDLSPGSQFGQFTLVGVSGWVSSARELVKLMIALRGESILPASVVNDMFAESIGWNLPGNVPTPPGPAPFIGNFGTYYWKEGGLSKNNQALQTFLVRLGEGYDLALLVNSAFASGFSASMNSICFNAFDARGLRAANFPSGGPVVLSAVHAGTYLPDTAPGGYVAIIGSGFTTGPAANWTAATGNGTALPQELSAVQVRVGGVNAYVEYVSANQLYVLLPAAVSTGIVDLGVTAPGGSFMSSLLVQTVAPGLFTYSLSGRNYAIAVYGDTDEVLYVARAGAIAGLTSRPARAGDTVELYGTGMGPTNPPWPDGSTFVRAYAAQNLSTFEVTIGSVQCPLLFAGMVEPGLFQIKITIPAGVPTGDQLVIVAVSGKHSPATTWLTMA